MPTPTFWTSEDKIPISQTKVSIPSENGLEYDGGDRIIFTIPAGQVDYFNPINTQLSVDLKIKCPSDKAPTRLQLDPQLGGSVLIRHMRVYGNSAEMPLLEELQDVNVLSALRYDYDKNDNLVKKRALVEGTGIYDSRCRTEFGGQKRLGNTPLASSFFTPNVDGSEKVFDATDSDSGFKTAKLLIPLHMSGIFGSSVVFPNMLVSGLRVELILCENKTPFCQLPSVMKNNQPESNPRFFGVNRTGGDWDPSDNGDFDNNATDTFYVARTNNMIDVEHLPFCVGEEISMLNLVANPVNDANGYITWVVSGQDPSTTNQTHMRVPKIKKISLVAGDGTNSRQLVEIVLTESVHPDSSIAGYTASPDEWALYSVSLNAKVGDKTHNSSWEPTFTLSNCELLVEKVQMPDAYTSKMMTAMKQGGTINYDFLSFTNYKYSQLANDRVANIRVPIMNKRCKGVLCIPTDASVYSARDKINGGNSNENDATAETFTYFTHREGGEWGYGGTNDQQIISNWKQYSDRSGLVGIADGITQYQFFYDGRLNPSRKVDTKKISNRVSIAQQPLVELEKALAVCNINPHSFSEFQRNFCIARAVGIQNGVSDLSTTDFNLQVEYQDSENDPTKNKLWNIYIGHLRRLMIKGDSVMVDV